MGSPTCRTTCSTRKRLIVLDQRDDVATASRRRDVPPVDHREARGGGSRGRTDATRPLGTVLRNVSPWSIAGNTRSSAYFALPVALPMPSLRGTFVPTTRMT